jgi:hypothetical protein
VVRFDNIRTISDKKRKVHRSCEVDKIIQLHRQKKVVLYLISPLKMF